MLSQNAADDLENVMGLLGDFGRYQMIQFILHLLSGVSAGIHMMSLVTVAAVPAHRCEVPEIDSGFANDTALLNRYLPTNSTELFKNYIPVTPDGALARCTLFVNSTSNETMACSKFVYDTTHFKSSRGIEWDFVCDRQWMGSMAQSAYMFGVLVGAAFLGGLADKIGRKPVFCWSATFTLILGVLVAFIPEFYTFLFIRFLYGIFGTAGSYICGFVLTMELVGASKRTFCGISFQVAFAFGIMIDAFWGYFVKDRFFLQVIYGLHTFMLIAHWWIMDESPRWLWGQGRIGESVKIIQKALKINKRNIELDATFYEARHSANSAANKAKNIEKKPAGMLDLFKTPNLRYKTLNVCFCWFANSMVYYGLSLGTGTMEGDPYLLMFLMALVEIPSYVIVILLMDRLGRRSMVSTMMLVGGSCCLACSYITSAALNTVVVMLGKLLISGSFSIIYNYSAELFPTAVRNTAMGLGSMCARFSGMLTPFILILVSANPTLPSFIFSFVAIFSGFLTLFLPETNGQPMPQSIEDGETFGAGDTCFSSICGRKKRRYGATDANGKTNGARHVDPEQMVPLEPIVKS